MNNARKKWLRGAITLAVISLFIMFAAAIFVRRLYNHALQPVSNSQKVILVDVPIGSSVQEIGEILEKKKLIRQTWAFEYYVRNSGYRDELKAGTYALRPSQGVIEIVGIIAQGKVATDLVTIVPGQRIDQVEATLINSGFNPKAVSAALQSSRYKDHPALVDKPQKASLEGYLYPDSFQKTSQTNPEDIIRASLNEMQQHLTPSIRSSFARQRLSVHDGIILASIVEKEVSNLKDRAIVASVFLNRLKQDMRLESDATVLYGAIAAGQEPSLTFDSAYNTYKHKGLPPGPISNMSASALAAVAHPARTPYLYFVSGDDGKTYFSKTLREHERAVEAHCKQLCGE